MIDSISTLMHACIYTRVYTRFVETRYSNDISRASRGELANRSFIRSAIESHTHTHSKRPFERETERKREKSNGIRLLPSLYSHETETFARVSQRWFIGTRIIRYRLTGAVTGRRLLTDSPSETEQICVAI